MFKSTKSASCELNIIPLINVIFLLLIFFMIAGRLEKPDTIETTPPMSLSSEIEESFNSAVVYIQKDGQIAVNEDIVALKDLKTIITAILLNTPNREITIKADAKTEANKLIEILNIIEKSGGKNISLITQTAD